MDQLALPTDCCTFMRLAIYYAYAGLLPIPTVYLALTEPCDGVAGMHAALMHHPDWRNVPTFAPDPPYGTDPRSIQYYAGEMRRMVDFLSKHTGKTLDMTRLKQVVEETNKGYALWMEYNEIRRSTLVAHDSGAVNFWMEDLVVKVDGSPEVITKDALRSGQTVN